MKEDDWGFFIDLEENMYCPDDETQLLDKMYYNNNNKSYDSPYHRQHVFKTIETIETIKTIDDQSNNKDIKKMAWIFLLSTTYMIIILNM